MTTSVLQLHCREIARLQIAIRDVPEGDYGIDIVNSIESAVDRAESILEAGLKTRAVGILSTLGLTKSEIRAWLEE